MACLALRLVTPSPVALVAGVAKTVLQWTTPSNQRGRMLSVRMGVDGTSAVAKSIRVQIVRQTTAGTGTSLTPVKVRDGLPETPQSTAAYNFTSEPTYGDVLFDQPLTPYMGVIDLPSLYEREIENKGGGRLGLVCTLQASETVVNVSVTQEVDE